MCFEKVELEVCTKKTKQKTIKWGSGLQILGAVAAFFFLAVCVPLD